jgi:hypothetical protein
MKRRAVVAGALLAVIGALWSQGCGSSDSGTPPGPPPPATLSITSIQGVGSPAWLPGSGSCVEVGRDATQTVVVSVSAAVADGSGAAYALRPPGACGSVQSCGTVILRIDPSGDTEAVRVRAAQSAIAVAFGGLSRGSHTFRAELVNAAGNPVRAPEGGVGVYSEVTLDVTDPGGCSGDAGSDAGDAGQDASDAASDASDAGSDASDASDADAGPDASDGGPDASDATADGPDDASDASDASDADAD